MKQIIAIIGNANIDNDTKKQKLSFLLGKLVIDSGFSLATGGLGGVMYYASKGAMSSKNYTANSIIGVLPSYENSNEYVDLIIPTGMGLARNTILISMANAVIAVGGGSGTLNEISAAWQLNKLIVALEIDGWSKTLCNKALDNRRDDVIFGAKTAKGALQIIKEKINNYQLPFKGVASMRSYEKAEQIIQKELKIKTKLSLLAKGSEGFIFTDKKYIYKLIDTAKNAQDLYWILLGLRNSLEKTSISAVGKFDIFLVENNCLIKHHAKTNDFKPQNADKFIKLLQDLRKINWVFVDMQPKNLRITDSGDLSIINIGRSFMPYSQELFKAMSKRTFVCYKLQNKQGDIKKYLSSVNKKDDFLALEELGFKNSQLQKEFKEFYKKAQTTDKKNVLNPLLKNIFSTLNAKTVFDYGSGQGDISKMLSDMGFKVTSYDPDTLQIAKNKDTYYKNIQTINYEKMQDLIQKQEKFDALLCSLVLCHLLEETEDKRLKIIDKIMQDLVQLCAKNIVITICNPLYTFGASSLQERNLPKGFDYSKNTKFTKKIHSSNNTRPDIHRPLSFYENLFIKHDLKIKNILQTNDFLNTDGIYASDFLIFVLEKNA